MEETASIKNESAAASHLGAAKRAVLKVGSALLLGPDGALDGDWLAGFAEDAAGLRASGCEVILVTSGAVALGRDRLGLKGRLRLEDKQAAAAAGQARLVEAWQEAFAPHRVCVAQMLLTLDDAENRRRYLNARATLQSLIALSAVPLINENDTVATAEIRYGDNDRLAAHAAQMAGADLLVLFSDIDGLYEADPRVQPGAAHIPVVEQITPEIAAMAGGPNRRSESGTGGMETKIEAAKIATAAGAAAIIAQGDRPHPIAALAEGARATFFKPRTSPERARRRWIGGRLKPAGAVHVDAGAVAALTRGASLLPAGVMRVEGNFAKGDAVAVYGPDAELLGHGLCAYDAGEARLILGRKSEDIETILGYRRQSAIIHRDDLALAWQLDKEAP
ncbi:MAG: glutamate 5-kinase [Parvularculaceae bacterium]